jgi:DNA invertase Pin-like site-specific DNA recombinase
MLVFHMRGAIAEFERSPIRERAPAGLDEARRQGRTEGRLRSLTGKDVAAAEALLAAGSLSAKEVASRIGISNATLYRYLSETSDGA